MCYLQNLCVETQRENRRCGRAEAYAVVPYVCVCVCGRLWATHQGRTSPPGTCNLGGAIINLKVTAAQALGRVSWFCLGGLERLHRAGDNQVGSPSMHRSSADGEERELFPLKKATEQSQERSTPLWDEMRQRKSTRERKLDTVILPYPRAEGPAW